MGHASGLADPREVREEEPTDGKADGEVSLHAQRGCRERASDLDEDEAHGRPAQRHGGRWQSVPEAREQCAGAGRGGAFPEKNSLPGRQRAVREPVDASREAVGEQRREPERRHSRPPRVHADPKHLRHHERRDAKCRQAIGLEAELAEAVLRIPTSQSGSAAATQVIPSAACGTSTPRMSATRPEAT